MELEGVGSVAMRGVSIKVLGKVDNIDSLKRALLHTDTATDAQRLRDERNLALLIHLNTELTELDRRARFLALMVALWIEGGGAGGRGGGGGGGG